MTFFTSISLVQVSSWSPNAQVNGLGWLQGWQQLYSWQMYCLGLALAVPLGSTRLCSSKGNNSSSSELYAEKVCREVHLLICCW